LAIIRLRHGALVDGEATARTAWQLMRTVGESAAVVYWWSPAALIDILIARGKLDTAAALFEQTGFDKSPPTVVIFPWPVALRGELALARGDTAEGVEILLEAGRWLEERGFLNPAYIPWRARVAPALAMLGRREEAQAVIEPAVRRARKFGAPWALGMALRAAGMVSQGAPSIGLLREAVAVLEPSSSRLEHAHALLELGAALRRANQRSEARQHLRVALDMAYRCGATPLETRAAEELAATGARPRRVVLSGADSLTTSERRVAELAARGMSNPEIAQQLFVSRRTVEAHLSHVYQKLDISSRAQIPDDLAATTAPSSRRAGPA
jgi:ATP/maltotriose-dependent transcriptional regulator MalT